MAELSTYRDNLRHVVRPDRPSERPDANRYIVSDYQALALQHLLREFEAYSADTDEHADIARAYIEYIDLVVREEGRTQVEIYAHTREARQVLADAVLMHDHMIDLDLLTAIPPSETLL